MKNSSGKRWKLTAVSLLISLALISCATKGNNDTYQDEILAFQRELNVSYLDSATTPLRGKNFQQFREHPFFPINAAYRFKAKLVRLPNPAVIEFPTSSGVSKKYQEFAVATFQVEGQNHSLKLYQSLALMSDPAYKDYLFLPFRDATNGTETYGGGRYLDLKIPAGDTIILDFNKTYQPYCAYNAYDYSCPIVPEENVLPLRIEAGVRYENVYFD